MARLTKIVTDNGVIRADGKAIANYYKWRGGVRIDWISELVWTKVNTQEQAINFVRGRLKIKGK